MSIFKRLLQQWRCEDCGVWLLDPFRNREQYDHLNPASSLPPVACPIVIELPGQGLKRAERTGFVTHKDNQMEYALADGSKIIGRFRWTYP
jgi:hypothetical protein